MSKNGAAASRRRWPLSRAARRPRSLLISGEPVLQRSGPVREVMRPGFVGDSVVWILGQTKNSTRLPLCQIDGELGARASRFEISVSDWLLAVGAEATGPDPTAEEVAVLAAADPEVAGPAGRALVDRVVRPGDRRWAGCALGVTGTPARLLARIRAEAPPARRGEWRRAPGAVDHLAIVTLS